MKKFISIVLTALLILSCLVPISLAENEISVNYDLGFARTYQNTPENPNPGSVAPDTVLSLETAECVGLDFDGWYLDRSFNEPVQRLFIDHEITVYAKWTRHEYSIKYTLPEFVNGRVDLPKTRMAFDGDLSLTEPMMLDDRYTFVGWCDEKTGETVTKIDESVCEDVSLVADFEKGAFKINYTLGSTENIKNPNPTEYTYGDSFKLLSATSLNKVKFEFDGWYTDEYFIEEIREITPEMYGNLHLYAKWRPIEEKNELKVKYVVENDELGVREDMVTNLNPTSITAGESFRLWDPTCANERVQFEGWYTDKNFSKESRVVNLNQIAENSATLYAKWEKSFVNIFYDFGPLNIYQVSLDNPNPVSVDVGETFKLSDPVIHNDGYIFLGWYSDSAYTKKIEYFPENAVRDTKVYAQIIEKNYTINYEMLTQNIGLDIKYISNPNPNFRSTSDEIVLQNAQSRSTSYAFLGWYTDKDFKNKIEKIDAFSCQNYTVYAKWAKVLAYVPQWGDVSMSGGLHANDARMILRAAARLEKLGTIESRLADITNDGNITSSDARIVLRLSANLEDYSAVVIKYNLPNILTDNGVLKFSK